MTKIVLNYCYGGYSLSEEAMRLLNTDDSRAYEEDRTNPRLVEVVETLGEKADGHCAALVVRTIPDEATDYLITEYDGSETLYVVVDGKIRVCY
jgi:hypothetical protein